MRSIFLYLPVSIGVAFVLYWYFCNWPAQAGQSNVPFGSLPVYQLSP